MSELKTYVEAQAAKKNRTPGEWLEKTIPLCEKCLLITHVGKFTNPDTKVNVYDKSRLDSCGYVMTATVNVNPDIVYSSAAYMAAATFLLHKLEDGRTVLEHVMEGTELVRKELEEIHIPFESLQEKILRMIPEGTPEFTDGRLRQVYFPVGQDYHLLTVLPSSSLMETASDRLQMMHNKARKSRNKDSENYGEPYKDISDRTILGFGGTKPQNISTLNSIHAGKAEVLMSMPPQLQVRNIRKPVRSFLDESIPYWKYVPVLKDLDKLLHEERNNIRIRNQILKKTQELIDIVLTAVFTLRNEEPGWTKTEHYQNLPFYQKIWLDESYKADRKSNPEWMESTSGYFGRWVLKQYKKVMKDSGRPLGDEELAYFKNVLQQVLEEEVRYEL